jgi:hypothetical protein
MRLGLKLSLRIFPSANGKQPVCMPPTGSVGQRVLPSRGQQSVTPGQNASNVSGVSLRTCQGTGPFLEQSRDRGSQHRHIAYIAQYIVTWFYKDAHRAGLATFRYHFTALYRDKRLNPNSSYGRIQTKTSAPSQSDSPKSTAQPTTRS